MMGQSASPKQLELLRVLADYDQPQPATVLARIVRYRGGATAPVVYDRLGALQEKGLIELVGHDWRVTSAGREAFDDPRPSRAPGA